MGRRRAAGAGRAGAAPHGRRARGGGEAAARRPRGPAPAQRGAGGL